MIANPIPWPNGNKCCVSLTWDIDAESGLAYKHRERITELVSTRSFLRYDAMIAVPRLVDVLRSLDLQQTFFFPGWVIERYPHAVDLLLKNGHEIGLHGYMHERSNELSRDEEENLLGRAMDAFVKRVGSRPKGWRAPGFAFSSNSAELLAQAGFAYDSSLMGSEIPYLVKTARGTLVELPVDWTWDDWPHYAHNRDFDFLLPISSPSRVMEVFGAEFESAWNHGTHWVTIWHAFLSGRPARLSAVVDLISKMRERGGVWFARLDEVCDHVHSLMQSAKWTPVTEELPFHDRPDFD